MGAGGRAEFAGLGLVDGEGFFAEDVFACEEAEHGVLEVVGVWGGDVDDVDVGVLDEFVVGAVRFGGGGALAGLEEVGGAGGGCGGGCGGDGVGDVGDLASGGIQHQIFGEFLCNAAGC